MLAEVGQKEFETNVSPGKFKRLKTKVSMAYFVAKNDQQEVPRFSRFSYDRRKFELSERYSIFVYQ